MHEIEDSSFLEPAREKYHLQVQNEEERRLFYVALTRAMEDLFIYTWEPAMSEFLEEAEDARAPKLNFLFSLGNSDRYIITLLSMDRHWRRAGDMKSV